MRQTVDPRARTCLDCGELKPFAAFTPIRGTSKVYGRCKVCRARRARERNRGGVVAVPAPCQVAAGPAASDGINNARGPNESSGRRSSTPRQVAIPDERTCTACGETKPLSGFLRIRTTKTGYYG